MDVALQRASSGLLLPSQSFQELLWKVQNEEVFGHRKRQGLSADGVTRGINEKNVRL